MSIKPAIIRCTCCQSEITMPQFYNGNPYGYVCIRKIDPAFKRTKVNYIPCDSFKILQGEGTARMVVRVAVGGKAWNETIYVNVATKALQGAFIQDDVLFLPETKVKG